MTNIVHFSGLKVKIVKCDHSLSHTLFGTPQKCDKMHRRTLFGFAEWNSSLWLFSVLYSIRHAPQLNLTYIVHFFFGLQSKKVKFDHSLSHTLFGTWQKFDIHRRCFKFPEWEKSTLIILYLVLYSARSRSVAYIVHFSGFTLPHTLFGTQQKCDIHHLSVSGFKSENSQLWSFFNSYAIRHTAEMWLSYIFWFTKWKKSSLVNLFRTLHGMQQKSDIHRSFF